MKKISCLLLMICLLLTFVGCGSSEMSEVNYSEMNSMGVKGDYSFDSYAPEVVSESYNSDAYSYEETESYEPSEPEQVNTNRKLVYTYDISAEASDVAGTRSSISKRVYELGGYISNDNFYEMYDGRESWDATIRIPTEHKEEMSTYISEGVRITRSNISVSDVTLNYADNEARLNVERQAYEEYEQMLQNATTTEELIAIRDELYRIQANIDSYETTLRYLNNDIDYTTFDINIEETRLGVNEDRNIWSAFVLACHDAGEELINFFADVIIGIPGFIIGIIILIFYLLLLSLAIKIIHSVWRKIKKKFKIDIKRKSKLERATELFVNAYLAVHKNDVTKENNKPEESNKTNQ